LKRTFDLILLISTFPFWGGIVLLCYIFNVLFEGFPGFYSSKRYIGHGKSISILKFRVMLKNIDKKLNRSTVAIDNQIFFNLPVDIEIYTSFGLILERFGITELPQFFSVLKGDMSIVGARPLPDNVFSKLNEKFPNLANNRFESKCGLTGLPQMVGRDRLSDEERLFLESSYANWANTKYSFLVDFKILFFTIFIVLGLKKKASINDVLLMLE